MTLASDLAHLVCTSMPSEPGIVHDPLSPLVLGDVSTGLYSVQTYNPVAKRWTLQVVSPAGSATFEFGTDGTIYVNGEEFQGGGGGSNPDLDEILRLCQEAQQAAETAAAQSGASAQSAADSVSDAEDQAILAAAFAVAPKGTELPGGGDSAAVSAQEAEQIAILSRELDISSPAITASHDFQSGFLFKEQQVTVTSPVVVTIPSGIFSSLDNKAAWSIYKLAAASGSVKVVASGGGSDLITPTIPARNRVQERIVGGVAKRNVIDFTTTIPSILAGDRLLLLFNAQHNSGSVTPNINLTNDKGVTFTTLLPLPSPASAAARADYAVYEYVFPSDVPGGMAMYVSFDEGPYCWFQAVDRFLIRNAGGPPRITVATGVNLRSQFSQTLTALGKQSLVIAHSGVGMGGAEGVFSNFSANMTLIAKGGSAGIADVLVPDTSNPGNQQWGLASGVSAVDGDFTVESNFSVASSRGNLILIAYPPKSSIGAGAVTLKLEGDRDTLTVPYGVMELWFQPDGQTVHVRTSKP